MVFGAVMGGSGKPSFSHQPQVARSALGMQENRGVKGRGSYRVGVPCNEILMLKKPNFF